MSITVNTNLSSLIAQRSLYKATNKMNTALERLSTGLKINSSKDDAAGSAISTKLGYKISSYDVAKDNAQMGQSMLETANGSLSQINSMLQRIRDLSEQASNGTYGLDERKAMQAEIDGLTEEIYRIKNTTEFNGKKIFGEEENKGLSSVPTMSMADVSADNWDSTNDQVIGISSAQELKKMADLINSGKDSKNRTFALTADIDLNELGDIDGNGSNWVAIGENGNHFKGIFNGNNYTISNLKINTDSTNTKSQGFIGFSENSTFENLIMKNCTINAKNNNGVAIISGHAMQTNAYNCRILDSKITGKNCTGTLFGDSTQIKVNNCYSENSIITTVGNFIGGLIGQVYGANNEIIDCYTSNEISGYTKGQFIGRVLNTATISNCYYNSSLNSFLKRIGQNDNVNYDIKESTTNPFTTQEMQVKTNLQVGINSDSNSTITVDTGFSLDDLNISVLNEFSARNSLSKIDEMMDKITAKMTEIGATQNRIESTMEFQDVQINALTSANSIIKDADIAEESSNYIKNQILQNVTSSLLATANQNPSVALQLL